MSSTHGEGSPVSGRVKTQFARPSARRSRSAAGSVNWMRRITTRWASSGSGDRLNSPRLRVANSGTLAHSVLATLMSLATMCGHGTHARQPLSSDSRDHVTVRSPLMANGRPMAALTRSLIIGRARFQSKVATSTTSTATRTTRLPTIPTAIFVLRVIVIILAVAAGAPMHRPYLP